MFSNKTICVALTVLSILSKSKQAAPRNRAGVEKMEGFIVGGRLAAIENFPHAAYLVIKCVTRSGTQRFSCGSSILNQVILLSAGHCFEDCLPGSKVSVSVGNPSKKSKENYEVAAYTKHPHYDSEKLLNDIALAVLTEPLKYSRAVSRVILSRVGIYNEPAVVAGWGVTDETNNTDTMYLMNTHQTVLSREECSSMMLTSDEGFICANGVKDTNDFGYAAIGDSGSALMVRGYIQIGIVSHKITEISKSIIVYTDVTHYYDWIITTTSKTLFCKTSVD